MKSIVKTGVGRVGFRLVVGFIACTALGLFFSIQFHLIDRQLERNVSWASEIHMALVNWYTWGLLAVLVFVIARRTAIGGTPWWARVAIHILCAGIIALVHTTLCASWYWLVLSRELSVEEWSWMFGRMFVLFFHWDVLIYAGLLGFAQANA